MPPRQDRLASVSVGASRGRVQIANHPLTLTRRMPGTRRRVMDATIAEIVEEEGMAREVAELAHELARDDHHATAQMLRHMGRRHRINALALRGSLAVLQATGDTAAESGD